MIRMMESNTPSYANCCEVEAEGTLPSLFLPLVAPAKYPPLPRAELPSDALIWLATEGAFRAMLPFKFGAAEGELKDVEDFNRIVQKMAKHRELVIKSPVTLKVTGEEDRTFVAEYAFATPLLRRVLALTDLAAFPDVTAYDFLVNLLAQGVSCRDEFQSRMDEFNNVWLFLSHAAPYRENSFFTNSALLIQTVGTGPLIKITIGETEDDIDEWYRYEWLSLTIKQYLHGAHHNL